MLVLSRKVGERILIGNDVIVEVHRIKGNVVHVAIDAPKEIVILRGELIPHPKATGNADSQN